MREEGGRDTMVARNRLTRNVLDGILIQFGANPIEVKGNRSDRNGDDGIDADEPATTVAASRADHNVDLGIEAVPGVIDGSGNRAKHNGNPLQCLNVVCRR